MLVWLKTRLRHLRDTMRTWRDDDGSLLAAALAYYATFSFFPMLLILISALGFVLQFSAGAQDEQQKLLELISQNASAELAANVETALSEIRTHAPVSGPVGLITLLMAAIVIFTRLEKAMDHIWGTKRRSKGLLAGVRRVLFRRLRAFLMLLCIGLLVFAAFVAGMVAAALRSSIDDLPYGARAWSLGAILLSVTVNWLLLTLIYKVLPKAPVRWSAASRGGCLAAILWEAARQVLAVVLLGKKYSALGVVGSLIVLMAWIYVASAVLLLGAMYVRVIHQDQQADPGAADVLNGRAREANQREDGPDGSAE